MEPDWKVVVRDLNCFSDELLKRIFQVNASVCTLKHKKQLKSLRNGMANHRSTRCYLDGLQFLPL